MSDQVDPITPPIADPQAVVDAALEPVPPAVTPVTPPVTPPVDPPVDPPVVPSSPSSVPMGDETPLAFVTPEPIASVNEPAVIPPDTTIPPATIPPAPEPVANKPKMKSKILLVVVGFFALLGALGVGGYYAYLSFGGAEIPTISYITKFTRNSEGKTILNPNYDPKDAVNEKARQKDLDIEEVPKAENKGTDQASCNGCLNGGWMVWRNGECKITGICNSGVAGKDTENPMGDPVTNATDKTSCENSGKGQWCASVDSNGKSYAFCMKNDGSQGTCNLRAVELGYTINYGAGVSTTLTATNKYTCICSTGTFYFDRPGVCNSGGVTTVGGSATSDFDVSKTKDPSYYDKWGLCGLVTNKTVASGTQLADYFSCFTCTGTKCTITNTAGVCSTCTTLKYTCAGQTKTSCLDNQTTPAITSTSSGKCGTVEQIDVMCGGHYIASTSVLNGACGEKEVNQSESATTTTTTPTMACTGLTRTPATAPSVGQAVTFSCAGSVTPSTAGTLSYKYRYSLNSGAYLPMTSNVLTIAACGSYSVQCQACATLNGVLTCDPTWTGATP